MTNYFIINLYDIEYLSYDVTNHEMYITYRDNEIVNISRIEHNINVDLLFKDIVKNMKDKFLIVDDKYYFNYNAYLVTHNE